MCMGGSSEISNLNLIFFFFVVVVGEGGEGGAETKTVCQTVSNEVKHKNATINTM